MCLLVIETDQPLRDNLAHHLRQRGFTVCIGASKPAVVRILGERNVSVVLLGLGGLRREGLDLLRQIKETSPKTEVILMTTSDSLQYSIEGMKLGAFDDVLVPYDIDLLCSKIKQAKYGRKASNVS
jgi:DNA-binding response OmpR family regulator